MNFKAKFFGVFVLSALFFVGTGVGMGQDVVPAAAGAAAQGQESQEILAAMGRETQAARESAIAAELSQTAAARSEAAAGQAETAEEAAQKLKAALFELFNLIFSKN